MKKTHLLFVTRSYPPLVGGLEQYCYDFYHSIKKNVKTTLLARRPKENLLLFMARVKFHLLFHGRKYTHVHFGDGLLSVLGLPTRIMTKAKLSVVVHALEIMHPYPVYQFFMRHSLPRFDTVVCVSKNTEKEARKRGAKKTIVIPDGIVPKKHKVLDKKKLFAKLKIKPKGKILFSVGRQIPRKGVAWFVEHVMPKLSKDTFVIAGTGEEIPKITKIITEKKLTNVYLVGRVEEIIKESLYAHSDWFVMPNVRVPHDAEGFGITIIEAGLAGCPVVAASVDGIPSAVLVDKTGFLVKEKDAKGFIDIISKKKLVHSKVKKNVLETFNWEEIAKRYVKALKL